MLYPAFNFTQYVFVNGGEIVCLYLGVWKTLSDYTVGNRNVNTVEC